MVFPMTRAGRIAVSLRRGERTDHKRQSMTLAHSDPLRTVLRPGEKTTRVILVRHGKPAIATNARTSHHGFRRYIDAYQDAGLDPQSAPPEELLDLVKG